MMQLTWFMGYASSMHDTVTDGARDVQAFDVLGVCIDSVVATQHRLFLTVRLILLFQFMLWCLGHAATCFLNTVLFTWDLRSVIRGQLPCFAVFVHKNRA